MKSVESRAIALANDITRACIRRRLNLTVYDGKIGIVDQKARKIVALLPLEHTMKEVPENAGK